MEQGVKNKINIKLIGFFILAFILISFFFSRTVYTYNLPIVTAYMPKTGKLTKEEKSTGLADWAEIAEVYSDISGKIDEILVAEGDQVSQGQALMRLSFDREDIQTKLRELTISRNKNALDTENIRMNIAKVNRSIADLSQEVYKPDDVSENELLTLNMKIAKAEETLTKTKTLYESGVTPRSELDSAQYNLDTLLQDKGILLQTIADRKETAEKTVSDKEKDRAKQLQSYNDQLAAYDQDLKAKELELQNLAIQQESYEKQLAKFDANGTIYAPSAGIITSIPVKAGQMANAHQHVASMGIGNTYEITCRLSLENNFVTTGDTVEIANATHKMDADVVKITPVEGTKKITLRVSSDEISTGETFTVTFQKKSAESGILVPNGAVHKDSDGYFLYQIKQRQGILGDEYYVAKQSVYIGDSDNENTIITKGVGFFDPIVTLSNKALSENNTVKVKNEEDFFAH